MKFVLVTFFSVAALATLVQSQEWIPWSTSKGVPTLQAARGRESDYRPLYIIRAPKGVDPWIPGKYNADFRGAFIAFNGKELMVTDFELFVGTNVKWIAASNGKTPANAVVGGVVQSGEKLYIGRAAHDGTITPGKIQPSQGALFIPYGGLEIKYTNYEQLVYVDEDEIDVIPIG